MRFPIGTVVGSSCSEDGKWSGSLNGGLSYYLLIREKGRWSLRWDNGHLESYMWHKSIKDVDADVKSTLGQYAWKILSTPKAKKGTK